MEGIAGAEGADGDRGIGAGGGTGVGAVHVGMGGAVSIGFLFASPALNDVAAICLSASKMARTWLPGSGFHVTCDSREHQQPA